MAESAPTIQIDPAQNNYVFTSESVSEGHPDKICDQISDAILDLYMQEDPYSRTAVECATTTNYVGIFGETRGPDSITHSRMEEIARQVIKDIGYDQEGFSHRTAEFDIRVHKQSVDIAQGVDAGTGVDKEEGAGDQGIMFGYACRETDALMPAAIHYSHKILQSLAEARHNGALGILGPDSKSQVSLQYIDGKPVKATSVVVSTQHDEDVSQDDIRNAVRETVTGILPEGWMCDEDNFYVNPTGRFVIGGPVGDAGLTGRKIIVDTYGGACPHGGGAFSGKDPTKVDRSAAYASRYAAKNIVAAGYADKCTIQLSYAIGISRPLSVFIDTHGTGTVPESVLIDSIQKVMDFTPRGIRQHLGLNKPIYARTAKYGHFGRDPEADGGFSWERTDLVKDLQNLIG
ncbi:MAG: methionine adenosyltransferase [Alphaproteobacteria bacterium]|jgi:S-adenosylmethionine synthetase|nr:methionine adenosyltransferase [Alphaproteobacteria bacterium]MDP7222579.1 methionine adenosyltransferase [Alphaproteobacteria bacterium]